MQRLGKSQGSQGLRHVALQQYQVRAIAMARESRRRRKVLEWDPLRKSFPQYQVSELVLNLDAEGNPHVRQSDELDAELETAKWATRPEVDAIVGRIDDFSHEVAKADVQMKSTASVPNPWRISTQDIFSAALLGTSKSESSTQETNKSEQFTESRPPSILNEVLRRNGIPQRITQQDTNKVIQFMLHRQEIAQKQIESPDEFQKALSRCESIPEIRRLVFQTAQTASGCEIVSKCEEVLVRSLSLSLKFRSTYGNVMASMTLVHNLTNNLLSRRMQIGRSLCHLGLELSSTAVQLHGVRKYLEIGLGSGYFSRQQSVTDLRASSRVLSSSLTALLRALQSPESQLFHAREAHSELFTLLTGQSPLQNAKHASFRAALVESDIPAPMTYLTILAELGSVRTLWYESRNPFGRGANRIWQASQTPDLLVTTLLRYAENLQRGHPLLSLDELSMVGPTRKGPHLDVDQTTYSQDLAEQPTTSPGSTGPQRLQLPQMSWISSQEPQFWGEAIKALTKRSIPETMKYIHELIKFPFVKEWLERVKH